MSLVVFPQKAEVRMCKSKMKQQFENDKILKLSDLTPFVHHEGDQKIDFDQIQHVCFAAVYRNHKKRTHRKNTQWIKNGK